MACLTHPQGQLGGGGCTSTCPESEIGNGCTSKSPPFATVVHAGYFSQRREYTKYTGVYGRRRAFTPRFIKLLRIAAVVLVCVDRGRYDTGTNTQQVLTLAHLWKKTTTHE